MPSAQGHITIRRRPKNGDPGQDAVRYWLVPSVTAVKKKADGTLTPPIVSCSVLMQTGQQNAIETSDLFVLYYMTTATQQAMVPQKYTPKSNITLPSNTAIIVFELYKSGTPGTPATGNGARLDRVTIPIVSDGQNGKQGLQGCIYRRSKWASGFNYHNDSASDSTGLRYIDLVYITPNNSLFASKAKWFRCRKTHTATTNNAPQLTSGGTESWLEFWEPLNSMEPIYTPLLLADDAVITLMQSNQLLIENDEGVITAGLSGSNSGKKIRIWAGASKPDDAPFRVDENGALVSTKADITGTINATAGRIAGFNIIGSHITNEGFDNDAAIIIRNDERDVVAAMGANILPGHLGGTRAIARFQNNAASDYWGETNYGVMVSAKGASEGNIAIGIEGGCVQGLALKTMFVGLDYVTQLTIPTYVSKTIGRDVNSLLAVTAFFYRSKATDTNGKAVDYEIKTREVRLTLPTMEHYDDGHVLFIKRGSNNDNVIKVYPGTSYRLVPNSSYTGFVNTYGRTVILNDDNTYNTSGDPMVINSEGDAMILIYHRSLSVTIKNTQYHGVWVQHKCPRRW